MKTDAFRKISDAMEIKKAPLDSSLLFDVYIEEKRLLDDNSIVLPEQQR